MTRDRRRDVGRRIFMRYVVHGLARGYMFQYDLERSWHVGDERLDYGLDEDVFAIVYIGRRWRGYLRMYQQEQSALRHGTQCRIYITYVGDARFAIGRRSHWVILARVYASRGLRLAYFVGSGRVRQVQRHQRHEGAVLLRAVMERGQ